MIEILKNNYSFSIRESQIKHSTTCQKAKREIVWNAKCQYHRLTWHPFDDCLCKEAVADFSSIWTWIKDLYGAVYKISVVSSPGKDGE